MTSSPGSATGIGPSFMALLRRHWSKAILSIGSAVIGLAVEDIRKRARPEIEIEGVSFASAPLSVISIEHSIQQKANESPWTQTDFKNRMTVGAVDNELTNLKAGLAVSNALQERLLSAAKVIQEDQTDSGFDEAVMALFREHAFRRSLLGALGGPAFKAALKPEDPPNPPEDPATFAVAGLTVRYLRNSNSTCVQYTLGHKHSVDVPERHDLDDDFDRDRYCPALEQLARIIQRRDRKRVAGVFQQLAAELQSREPLDREVVMEFKKQILDSSHVTFRVRVANHGDDLALLYPVAILTVENPADIKTPAKYIAYPIGKEGGGVSPLQLEALRSTDDVAELVSNLPFSNSSGFIVVRPHESESIEFSSADPVGKNRIGMMSQLFDGNALKCRAFMRNARPLGWIAPEKLSTSLALFGTHAFQDVVAFLRD